MEKVIFDIFALAGADLADFLILVVLIVVYFVRRADVKERGKDREAMELLKVKYYKLNTSVVRTADRIDPTMVKMHYDGDYYVDHPLNKPNE
jgi:hypothetical protein